MRRLAAFILHPSAARPALLSGVILFFSLLAAYPLFANSGFLLTRGGGDSPFLLLRLHQLLAALEAGQFPARWMPDAAYGYGFPFFSYYAALPYYLAALLRWYGFSYVLSLKLTQLAALVAAAAGTYAWARALPGGGLSRPRAVLASAAFTFAPFHLANLYVRGDSLSELWAMAFFPWLLWALQRCLDAPGLVRAFTAALLTGGLVFSHNISALNFMPFAGLYVLLGAWHRWRAQPHNSSALSQPTGARGPSSVVRRLSSGSNPWLLPFAACVGALLWGLGLAAFFWLPALRETSAVQIGDVVEGFFFYGNHFRSTDLVQTSLFFTPEVGPELPTPFAMGLVQAVLGALGLAAWLWRAVRERRWTALDTFLLLGLLLSTWMITPASAWVWEHLPLVRFTQFPWRFLSIQALFVSIITAHLVPARGGPWLQYAAALAASAALAWFGLGALRPDFIPLRVDGVTPARLHLLEYFSANIGSTIGYEYLPRDVAVRPFTSEALLGRPPALKVLAGDATGTLKDGVWTIDAAAPSTVALPTYYWPGWNARLDGQPVPVRPALGLGWIALDVPAGAHSVELMLGRTPLRAAAEAISAVLLLAALASISVLRRTALFRAIARPSTLVAVALAGLLGFAGYLLLRARPAAYPAYPLSMDFVQLAFPHESQVTFQNGARLLDLDYSPAPGRGQAVTIASLWEAPAQAEVTFELRPASNLLNAVPSVLAAGTQPLLPGSMQALTHRLTVPSDVPPGLYFVTVTVHENGRGVPALTSAGRERGLVHLAPLLIDDERTSVASESLGSFGPRIDLLSADLAPAAGGQARLQLTWHARDGVPGSYVLAVRLRDAGGLEWSAVDAQTAYGYYPTHLWRPGEVVPDSYGLKLPAGAPPGDYALSLDLHDPATNASLGHLDLTRSLSITTPIGDRTPTHILLPALGVAGVSFPARIEQGDAPEVRTEWLTLAAPEVEYRARWTLTPHAGGEAMIQTLDLAPGSHTSQWPAGAYVLGRTRFGTAPAVAPGVYDVTLQLEDAAGQLVGLAVAVGPVEITGRARVFEVPPLEVTVGARFGEVLSLHGYDAVRNADALRLTLAWGALDAPGRDYKYFVHLFNQADGFVAAQVDAIPRGFTYPTVLWLPGEVVTDTVTLPLAGLNPGTYGIAVGWYDPNDPALTRLPARDAAGAPLNDDRLVLPLEVEVR